MHVHVPLAISASPAAFTLLQLELQTIRQVHVRVRVPFRGTGSIGSLRVRRTTRLMNRALTRDGLVALIEQSNGRS